MNAKESLKQILDSVIIKSRAIILTRVQSKANTEPSCFSSLFNLPYSKDIHYFSQARHLAHSSPYNSASKVLYIYYKGYFLVFGKHRSLELRKCQRPQKSNVIDRTIPAPLIIIIKKTEHAHAARVLGVIVDEYMTWAH